MKILHIISSLKIGGAEQALCNLLSKLKSQGNEHIVAFFHAGPHIKTLEQMGIATHQIQGLMHPFDPLAFLRLRKFIKKSNPDVMHTALWGANIMGRILGFMLDIPVISDLHGNALDEGTFRNTLDRWTAHLPHHIIAVSDTVHDAYQTCIIDKIRAKKLRTKASGALETIKNSIDIEATRKRAYINPLARSEIGLYKDAFVIGTVGRLEPIKSYDILIKAFSLVYQTSPHLQLCIVGDGSQKDALKKLATMLGIEKQVIFTGFRNDAHRFYPLFDCFALSSQSEGLSIALLEALCFGLPIITTHHTPKHDVIKNSVNGFLVKPNNAEAFGKSIYQLQQNKDLQTTMRQENLKHIHRHFNLDDTYKAYQNLYEQCHKNSKRNI